MNGGYDQGYSACSCFWGRDPGRLVRSLTTLISDFNKLSVLDAGCGEGKNAAFLAQRGAQVRAVDVSELAITNGKLAFGSSGRICWEREDIRTVLLPEQYDIVIAYGLLHCLPSRADIFTTVQRLQGATKPTGFNIICAFNSRAQDLSAHPDLTPTLLDHQEYLDLYRGWELLDESDTDLTEVHPHNNISHTHSLTRILARKN